jgi:hypothetical protein
VAQRELTVIGQPLFLWETPDGYPDSVDWWAGAILQRWNFCTNVTNLAAGDVVFDPTPLMQVNTADGIAAAIGRRAFGGEMPAELKQRLTAYLAAAPVTAQRVREAFALALSSTAFQWY